MAEIELSVLARQCLDRRILEQTTLQQEVAAGEKRRNQQSRTVDWQFTTSRIKLKRLYLSFLDRLLDLFTSLGNPVECCTPETDIRFFLAAMITII